MKRHLPTILVLIILIVVAGGVGWQALIRLGQQEAIVGAPREVKPVAVEVSSIESGTVRDVRIFSGTLEASARFVVATKVGGLIKRLLADLGDQIEREQIVAEIDDAEFVQAVAQAAAELAVRKAEQARAESSLQLAKRDFDRAQELKLRGIASESQLDETSAALASAEAALALSKAQVQQAEAALELARIRLGYTQVRASWSGGEANAIVGERFQDAGNTVQVGDPIVSVVELDPLTAIVSVTERDYAKMRLEQIATLTTDALPGRAFEAEVVRISPVFREASRQARIELRVENPDQSLRPGMFVRVRIVLAEETADAIVPLEAITRRDGRDVVFVVDESGTRVTRREVTTGIVEGGRVQVAGEGLRGRVVVLGQQLLEDGSAVTVNPNAIESEVAAREPGA